MSSPLVSFIVPAHNRVQLLPLALESLLGQTVKDVEIVVVDDGSTDGTLDYIASIPDRRVRVVRSEHQSGPGAARNLGLTHARGRYIGFLDSDDESVPDRVGRQIAALEAVGSPSVALVIGGFVVARTTGLRRQIRSRVTLGLDPLRSLVSLNAGPVTTSTFLVTRGVLEAGIVFDEKLRMLEDLDYAIRVAERGVVVSLDEPIVRKRRDSGREHAYRDAGSSEYRQMLLRKHSFHLPHISVGRLRHLLRIAGAELSGGDVPESLRFLSAAQIADPLPQRASLARTLVRFGRRSATEAAQKDMQLLRRAISIWYQSTRWPLTRK